MPKAKGPFDFDAVLVPGGVRRRRHEDRRGFPIQRKVTLELRSPVVDVEDRLERRYPAFAEGRFQRFSSGILNIHYEFDPEVASQLSLEHRSESLLLYDLAVSVAVSFIPFRILVVLEGFVLELFDGAAQVHRRYRASLDLKKKAAG